MVLNFMYKILFNKVFAFLILSFVSLTLPAQSSELRPDEPKALVRKIDELAVEVVQPPKKIKAELSPEEKARIERRQNANKEFRANSAYWKSKGLELIVGDHNHISVLHELLQSAQERILITSDKIKFLPIKIYDHIQYVISKGVTCDMRTEKNCLDETFSAWEYNLHGKHLIADRQKACIGSFNWLHITEGGYDSLDVSLFMTHPGVADNLGIYKKVMETLVRYNRVDQAKRKKQTPKKAISDIAQMNRIQLDETSTLDLLTTLDHHENFFNTVCQNAKKEIKIYSPFLKINNAKRRLKRLAEALPKDGSVKVVLKLQHLADADKEPEIISKLETFISKQKKLKDVTTIIKPKYFSHHKSLMVDNKVFAIGSFNWFSAATAEKSPGHRQDTTVVLNGPVATHFIKSLYRQLNRKR